jgi:hypothetical protein
MYQWQLAYAQGASAPLMTGQQLLLISRPIGVCSTSRSPAPENPGATATGSETAGSEATAAEGSSDGAGTRAGAGASAGGGRHMRRVLASSSLLRSRLSSDAPRAAAAAAAGADGSSGSGAVDESDAVSCRAGASPDAPSTLSLELPRCVCVRERVCMCERECA